MFFGFLWFSLVFVVFPKVFCFFHLSNSVWLFRGVFAWFYISSVVSPARRDIFVTPQVSDSYTFAGTTTTNNNDNDNETNHITNSINTTIDNNDNHGNPFSPPALRRGAGLRPHARRPQHRGLHIIYIYMCLSLSLHIYIYTHRHVYIYIHIHTYIHTYLYMPYYSIT